MFIYLFIFECDCVKAMAGALAYLLLQRSTRTLLSVHKALAHSDYYFHFILCSWVMILPM